MSRFFIGLSIQSANAHAIEIAVDLKKDIDSGAGCTKTYDKWKKQSANHLSPVAHIYGEFGTKYRVSIYCNPEEESYSVVVRLNIDEDFYIKGVVNEPLKVKYGHFSNNKEIEISPEIDLSKVANMEY